MQEQLITLETAKLAKEKEFFVETSDFSFTAHSRIDRTSLRSVGKKFLPNYEEKYFSEWNEYYLFPTQSALQKWLREVYNILVDVVAYYDEEQLPLTKNNLQKPKGYFYWDYYDEVFNEEKAVKFETYEEALELGLLQALKLIEIAQKKNKI